MRTCNFSREANDDQKKGESSALLHRKTSVVFSNRSSRNVARLLRMSCQQIRETASCCGSKSSLNPSRTNTEVGTWTKCGTNDNTAVGSSSRATQSSLFSESCRNALSSSCRQPSSKVCSVSRSLRPSNAPGSFSHRLEDPSDRPLQPHPWHISFQLRSPYPGEETPRIPILSTLLYPATNIPKPQNTVDFPSGLLSMARTYPIDQEPTSTISIRLALSKVPFLLSLDGEPSSGGSDGRGRRTEDTHGPSAQSRYESSCVGGI